VRKRETQPEGKHKASKQVKNQINKESGICKSGRLLRWA
jgi:hypothetical protein